MVQIESFIARLKKEYPLMQHQDIYKLIYQACFYTGHLVNEKGLIYLKEEVKNNNSDFKELLYEYIDYDCVRVNLRPYVKGFKLDDLFRWFKDSSIEKSNKDFKQIINAILGFDRYNSEAVHHSDIYRINYHPSYRVVCTKFLSLEIRTKLVQNFINDIKNNLSDNQIKIICFDGRCGSGKSSIAKKIKNVTLIKCDEHFSQDAPIDYLELIRIFKELNNKTFIKEKCFDCSSGNYYEQEKIRENIILVEGSFGYLPQLRPFYDYLIYSVCPQELQKERLKNRESEEMLERYNNIWIPREEKYFESFDFIGKADLLV